MDYVAGIDLGSGYTKAVILAAGEMLGRSACRTGVNFEQAARSALESACTISGIQAGEIAYIATTGFGRYRFSSRDVQITEITSAARGAHFLFPEVRCVLDIGSQSTRAIATTAEGKVRTFKTNDKCAAGSGSFITRAAKYMQVEVEEIGELALKSTNPRPISSVCAVLAESEIINHITNSVSIEDIVGGIYDSLADRSAALLGRVGMAGEIVFIGGVALQKGAVRSLEQRLKVRVAVPPNPEYVCALGAAILGVRRLATAMPVTAGPEQPTARTAR